MGDVSRFFRVNVFFHKEKHYTNESKEPVTLYYQGGSEAFLAVGGGWGSQDLLE